jgi:rhamnosyltransferase
MNRSIALGFVIYNPEEAFSSRVQLAVDSGFDAYIFDNTPEKRSLDRLQEGSGRVNYLTCGKNHGLGLGIQAVCAQAYYQNHTALVFFDQDSVFDANTLDFIEKFYVEHPELKFTHSTVVFNSVKESKKARSCFKDVALAINSGSLFYLNNLKTLGWHNDSYFVDGVDYEFCLRSSLGGFKVAEYSCTPGFDHATEQPDRQYRFLWKAYAMRAYAFSRIQDVTVSSFRLIFSALIGRQIKFAYRIARHWIVFMVMQTLVRILRPIDRD